jgi:hypothetical protein
MRVREWIRTQRPIDREFFCGSAFAVRTVCLGYLSMYLFLVAEMKKKHNKTNDNTANPHGKFHSKIFLTSLQERLVFCHVTDKNNIPCLLVDG